MTKRMLIDSTHPEETRVVVVDGKRLEDFDFETATKKQLKGNIYLARVTRVEPSLQAAFVEYGGNRHGFLAFSEIHPDYYRIPIEDREALLEEERARESEELDDEPDLAEPEVPDEPTGDAEAAGSDAGEPDDAESGDDAAAEAPEESRPAAKPETVGGDAIEEVRRKRKSTNRRYKIQEVVSRRQIMLVQVVKEERGNKGAALTTYLSLAGRYCVLMPNTARGGGVSRKITHAGDRKRLKQIVEGLDVPDGMAVIVRTAGSQRTKAEIKRDYEYLLRLWDEIRETTLSSTAPCLIYEEANLIKRSIRDLYTRDIDEVQVEGEDGYRVAKNFMKTLIPSHAKRVQPYRDPHTPLLHRFQVESQLDAIHSPVVELRSGGYVVLNQTEALVAIDVNSGRATSERNIEETALKTNLEAADEIARQLRLRDLAGLIVIDFIDMEESRNQHAVERRMKEAMKSDRARIQIGRISHFGLMELSRQRLRPSLFEASTQICPHCKGTGHIRSIESAALHILRVIEEEGMRNRAAEIAVHVPASVALYILNYKRERLAEIEARYGFSVFLEQDEALVPPDHRLERRRPKTAEERAAFQSAVASATPGPVEEEEEDDVVEASEDEDEDGERGSRRRKRRRGGRRRGVQARGAESETDTETETSEDAAEDGDGEPRGDDGSDEDDDEDGAQRKRRRRGRRGGRRRSRRRRDDQDQTSEEAASDADAGDDRSDQEGSDQEGSSDAGSDTGDSAPAPANDIGDREPAPIALTDGSGDTAPPAEPETRETAAVAEGAEAVSELPETAAEPLAAEPETAEPATAEPETAEPPAAEAEPAPAKPKRPRRRKKAAEPSVEAEPKVEAEAQPTADEAPAVTEAPEPEQAPVAAEAPETAPEEAAPEEAAPEPAPSAEPPLSGELGKDETAPAPPQEAGELAADGTTDAAETAEANPLIDVKTVDKPVEKPRRGWWRR